MCALWGCGRGVVWGGVEGAPGGGTNVNDDVVSGIDRSQIIYIYFVSGDVALNSSRAGRVERKGRRGFDRAADGSRQVGHLIATSSQCGRRSQYRQQVFGEVQEITSL